MIDSACDERGSGFRLAEADCGQQCRYRRKELPPIKDASFIRNQQCFDLVAHCFSFYAKPGTAVRVGPLYIGKLGEWMLEGVIVKMPVGQMCIGRCKEDEGLLSGL